MQHITILFPHTTPLHAVHKVHTYSNSYMYNGHTVMYMHILNLQDHNRSEYSTIVMFQDWTHTRRSDDIHNPITGPEQALHYWYGRQRSICESYWHLHDMKLDASLYDPVFPPGHFSRAPCPAKISDRPSISYNNNNIILNCEIMVKSIF